MQTTHGTARPSVDWRDWIAFFGYVLATSVAVAVALGSVVLLLSTNAGHPDDRLGQTSEARILPAAQPPLHASGASAALSSAAGAAFRASRF